MDTTKEMLLDFAKNAKERKDKVYFLFRYLQKINHVKTKEYLIDMIGYTDLQIEQEVENWINIEKALPSEKIAIDKYNSGGIPNVSTFIDEDTIILGYGKLDYDFEFPLPNSIVIKEYGTTSWKEYFNNKQKQNENLKL